jgi:hypothetical protein
MAREYSLSGGAGRLITTDPDPLEVALRQAQLEELLQKPQIERAQLALQQQDLKLRGSTAASAREFDTFKANLEKQKAIESGDIDRAKLIEEQTRTKDTRAYQQGSLGEETRYHTGVLGEQKAGREQQARSASESTRGALMAHVLSQYGPAELAGQTPVGGVAAVLRNAGFGELESGMEEAHQGVAKSKAAQALPEIQALKPEQRTTAISEMPERTRKALLGMMNQPAAGVTGPPSEIQEPAAPKPSTTATPLPVAPPTAAPVVNPNVQPPTFNVDKLMSNLVGTPTMEELKRRRRSQQPAALTPFRQNQY